MVLSAGDPASSQPGAAPLDDGALCERIGAELSFAKRHRSFVGLMVMEAREAHGGAGPPGHQLAQMVGKMIRAEDHLTLTASGALAILIRDIAPPGARQMAERLCASCSRERFAIGEERVRFHIFVGLAIFPATDELNEDAPELVGRARAALARARANACSCVKA
jgi:hypothetical protein